jgi:hypothetical protein
MSQTNAIIVRIEKDKAAEFERMFKAEELPIWEDFHSRGRLLAASLTRVSYGSESDEAKEAGYVPYIILAVMKDMAAHTAHDEDERFSAFLKKARKMQPEGPSVWGGRTLFRVNIADR